MKTRRPVETPEQRSARIKAEVATWPRLTPERLTELRRLMGPAIDRYEAQQIAEDTARRTD